MKKKNYNPKSTSTTPANKSYNHKQNQQQSHQQQQDPKLDCTPILTLPGTTLEGGGQLIRLAIGLASLTHTPVRITNVRGNRSGGGGLKMQHLRAVEWLGRAAQAKMEGCVKGGVDVAFWPGRGVGYGGLGGGDGGADGSGGDGGAGSWQWRKDLRTIDIGSPGAVTLVIQAILPYLVWAGSDLLLPSKDMVEVTIKGGTNVSKSPSVQYVQHVFLPVLAKLGIPRITLGVEKEGWATGHSTIGSAVLRVEPLKAGETLKGFEMIERGKIVKIEVFVLAPADYMQNYEHFVREEIKLRIEEDIEVIMSEVRNSSHDKRFYLLLVATSEYGWRLGSDWLYDEKIRYTQEIPGKMVKKVVKKLSREIEHGGCVDSHLRDQLVVFQALAEGPSEINGGIRDDGSLMEPDLHAETTYWIAKQILDVEFSKAGSCTGIGFKNSGTKMKMDGIVEKVAALEM